MAYTKTTFVNGQAPAVSADELNKVGQGIEDSFNQFKHDYQYTDFSQAFTIAVNSTVNIDVPVPEKRFYEIYSDSSRYILDVLNPSFLLGDKKETESINEKFNNPLGTTAASVLIRLWYSNEQGHVGVVEIQKLVGKLRFIIKQSTNIERSSTLSCFIKSW